MSSSAYPKTTLIFFGSRRNSLFGLYRSIVAFLAIVVVVVVGVATKRSRIARALVQTPRRLAIALVVAVVVVSALTVQVPTSTYDVVKYGASVGGALSIVAGAAIMLIAKNVSIANVVMHVAIAIVLSATIASFVFVIAKKLRWYPSLT
ncbi:MAG: hypothetical protein K0U52_13180 [Gammaproteobacteria bacterium]|nr:hypothetical protein [Gammaproteobacteria bacterium]